MGDRETVTAVGYNFDYEALLVCNAIGSPNGHGTVTAALMEAYAAGAKSQLPESADTLPRRPHVPLIQKWRAEAERWMAVSRASDAKGDGANSHTERARARIYRECADDLAISEKDDTLISVPDPLRGHDAEPRLKLSVCPDAVAIRVAQRVAELPDRSSPEDWPDAMLVTSAELQFIVTDEINEASQVGSTSLPVSEPSGVQVKDKNDLGALCATEVDAGPCSVPTPERPHAERDAVMFTMDDAAIDTAAVELIEFCDLTAAKYSDVLRAAWLQRGAAIEAQRRSIRQLQVACEANAAMFSRSNIGQRGSRNSQSKLTEDGVRAIRERLRAGETGASLSREYQVSENVIYQIKHNKIWTHVGSGMVPQQEQAEATRRSAAPESVSSEAERVG